MSTEAQKRAKQKYQKKLKRITVEFYPSESDLVEQIEKQPKVQSYIKELIRNDINRERFDDRETLLSIIYSYKIWAERGEYPEAIISDLKASTNSVLEENGFTEEDYKRIVKKRRS